MSEYQLEVAILEGGQFGPKFQVEGDVPTTSCRKTRCIDLSCGIRMWAEVCFVLSQLMRLTDGQIHGWTDRCSLEDRGCIAGAR